MLFVQSKIKIIDNSGARLAKIIKVLTPVSLNGRVKAYIGSLILLTLKKVLPLKKVKKGNLTQATPLVRHLFSFLFRLFFRTRPRFFSFHFLLLRFPCRIFPNY